MYGENQNEIVSKIKEEKPDLIFITGDVMYEKASIDNTQLLIKNIKDIAPVYYVTGNHEYADEKAEQLFDILKEYNITMLVDESDIIEIRENKIRISGLDDSEGYYFRQRDTTNIQRLATLKSNGEELHLLLSHRPELAEDYANNKFDVVFAGHAHGGQVRIPYLIDGVVAPNQGIFPKYTKGVYELKNNTKMVVSAGLIRNKVPRIYNKPDLVVTTIIQDK